MTIFLSYRWYFDDHNKHQRKEKEKYYANMIIIKTNISTFLYVHDIVTIIKIFKLYENSDDDIRLHEHGDCENIDDNYDTNLKAGDEN